MAAENLDGAFTIAPTGTERTHQRHEGLIVVPTTTGGVRVIRLHQPYETERVTFQATKQGAPPTVPTYEAPDTNRTFLGGGRSMAAPPPTASLEGHVWTVSGHYDYVLSVAAGLASEMPGAMLAAEPTPNATAEDANIPSTSFVTGLLGKQEGYQ